MRQAGTIQSLEFSELIVPAKPGVIHPPELDKPLHRIEPPFAYVPEGPGLGIELDEAAMAEYRLDRRTFE